MSAKPSITPMEAEDFDSAKLAGISSEQTTAIIAPAEKASAQGSSAETAATANTPIMPATISTAPYI